MTEHSRLLVENRLDKKVELTLEPVGTDHWMNPGETFTLVLDASSGDAPHIQLTNAGLSVWLDNDSGQLLDANGDQVECGYQRPTKLEALHDKWLRRKP